MKFLDFTVKETLLCVNKHSFKTSPSTLILLQPVGVVEVLYVCISVTLSSFVHFSLTGVLGIPEELLSFLINQCIAIMNS